MTMHPSRKSDSAFFMATGLFFLLVNIIGFGASLSSRLANEGSLPGHIYIHGVCASLWIVLYFIQTSLIASQKKKLHMVLGKTGVVILFLVLITGFYVAFMVPVLYSVEPPYSQPGRDFSAILIAVSLGFVGLKKRKNFFVHKRLMMMSTFILSSAGIGRFAGVVGISSLGPIGVIGLLLMPILCLIAYDYWLFKKVYKIDLLGVLMVGLLLVFAAPQLWENQLFQPIFVKIVEWLSF